MASTETFERHSRKPELVEGSVKIDRNKNANEELALAA